MLVLLSVFSYCLGIFCVYYCLNSILNKVYDKKTTKEKTTHPEFLLQSQTFVKLNTIFT